MVKVPAAIERAAPAARALREYFQALAEVFGLGLVSPGAGCPEGSEHEEQACAAMRRAEKRQLLVPNLELLQANQLGHFWDAWTGTREYSRDEIMIELFSSRLQEKTCVWGDDDSFPDLEGVEDITRLEV